VNLVDVKVVDFIRLVDGSSSLRRFRPWATIAGGASMSNALAVDVEAVRVFGEHDRVLRAAVFGTRRRDQLRQRRALSSQRAWYRPADRGAAVRGGRPENRARIDEVGEHDRGVRVARGAAVEAGRAQHGPGDRVPSRRTRLVPPAGSRCDRRSHGRRAGIRIERNAVDRDQLQAAAVDREVEVPRRRRVDDAKELALARFDADSRVR
jgi:hypothetical protein